MLSPDYSQLAETALSLPASQRAQLADQLILSLEPPQTLSDDEWCEEIRRRVAEVEAGTANTITAKEACTQFKK